jgi:hypothetical protein
MQGYKKQTIAKVDKEVNPLRTSKENKDIISTTQSKSNDNESTRMFGNNETVTQGGDNSSIHKMRTYDI